MRPVQSLDVINDKAESGDFPNRVVGFSAELLLLREVGTAHRRGPRKGGDQDRSPPLCRDPYDAMQAEPPSSGVSPERWSARGVTRATIGLPG